MSRQREWQKEVIGTLDMLVERADRICRELSGNHGQADLRPRLEFRDLGRTAGHCESRFRGDLKPLLVLNTQLADRPFEVWNNTLRHELAHAVVNAATPRTSSRRGAWSSHGGIWRRAALRLGCDGERCHTLGLEPTRKLRKWAYRATCGTRVELTTIRHNKVQRGAVYRVTKTGGKIKSEGLLRS